VLLTATIFAPLVGALLLALVPARAANLAKLVALVASLLTLGLAVALAVAFDPAEPGFQLGSSAEWVASLGIGYRVGVDGISLPLVLLTAVLTPLAVAGSWRMTDRVRGYLAAMLVLETAVLGVFSALDLFLFYIFFDAVLIPSYFMIGVWGGQRRVAAAIKFFLYTLTGGLLMLVGILGLYYLQRKAGGEPTFDYEVLRDLPKSVGAQRWIFLGFFAAFAVKTPLFPFHSWLPDAYTEAPPTTTVLLAGVLSKMGIYGFLRMCLPMLPDAAREFEPLILVLAVTGILYAAVVAAGQRDFNRLVAYSSISHMGFMALGTFAFALQGIQGAVFYMVAHGIIVGGLFLMIGMLRDRVDTLAIDQYGGLQKAAPRMAGVMLLLSLASAALPGLVGFVGEFLVLLGAFLHNRVAAVLAALGVILGAVYILWAYQRMWQGRLDERHRGLGDLSRREWAILGPVVAAILVLGLLPGPLLDRVEPAARQIVERLAPETTGTSAAEASP
jgi:NADH-quinone oxidoreductase subunit M